jgi:hypothetical protein
LKVLTQLSLYCLLRDLLSYLLRLCKGWARGRLSRLYCDRD